MLFYVVLLKRVTFIINKILNIIKSDNFIEYLKDNLML